MDQDWDLVKLFIIKGARDFDVAEVQGEFQEITPFWYAAYHGRYDIMTLMLEKGVKDIDATLKHTNTDWRGATALWFVLKDIFEHNDASKWVEVEKLLEKGAKELDAAPSGGLYQDTTAFFLVVSTAFSHGKVNLMLLMLNRFTPNFDAVSQMDASAIPNQPGHGRGTTPLWHMAYHAPYIKSTKPLEDGLSILRRVFHAGAGNLSAAPVAGNFAGKSVEDIFEYSLGRVPEEVMNREIIQQFKIKAIRNRNNRKLTVVPIQPDDRGYLEQNATVEIRAQRPNMAVAVPRP
jgi:hypothetical protein